MSTCERCRRDYTPLRRGYCNRCDASRRHMIGYQSSFVDAEPVRLHVKHLNAAGVGNRRICELTGLQRSVLASLINGKARKGHKEPPSRQVSRRTAEKILAVEIPDTTTLLRVVAGGERVPGIGTARRLRALVAIGYTQSYLADRIGWRETNLPTLLDDSPVSAATARKVAALFNELQMTPGPSDRSRRRAQRHGWAPPLAWDEDSIDDPAAQPVTSAHEVVPFPERYQELRDCGYSDLLIAQRMGIKPMSLLRQMGRYGLKPDAALVEEATAQRWAAS